MALKCYPLQPGGLLVIEAIAIGLTTTESVYAETVRAFPVILLLIFMVAGIHFLRELLLLTFTRMLLGVRSRLSLALIACLTTALLSAFLDALTVVAVVITVGMGFYQVFHRFASGKAHDDITMSREDADIHDAASVGPGSVPRLFAWPDDARKRRYGTWRRNHSGGRATESADRRARLAGVSVSSFVT